MTSRLCRGAALLLVLPLLASCGNGRGDQPADELLPATRQAAVDAGSVHVQGELLEDGRRVQLDLSITAGDGGRGTITQGGQTVRVVDTGDQLYLNADRAFWSSVGGEEAADRFAEKWLAVPPENTQSFAQFRAFTDLKGFVDQVFTPEGTVENDGEEDLDGKAVIALRDGEVDGSALFVAKDGPPLPVEVRGPRGSGQVTFDDWGGKVDTSSPAGAVDIATAASPTAAAPSVESPAPGAPAAPVPSAPAPTP